MLMFFDTNSNPINIQNLYKNQSCFLITSGPSLKTVDFSKLNQPGIVTLGLNNSPRIFRPNIWVSVDSPWNFMISIWKDPKIMKFIHLGKQNKPLYDNFNKKVTSLKVSDCPNIIHWKDNEWFRANKFLTEETINWGNHTDRCECGYKRLGKDETCRCKHKLERKDGEDCPECKKPYRLKLCPKCHKEQWGCRSVMLSAVRIAHILGFRNLFLLGCDFKMQCNCIKCRTLRGGNITEPNVETQNYAFEQERSHSSVVSNNSTYERLNLRFDQLRPKLEESEFYVWNCTSDSGLKSFDYMDLDLAIKIALKDFPDVKNEPTDNMYDRESKEKKRKKKK